MQKEEITLKSQTINMDGRFTSFKLSDGRELCFEACLNGFDIALYDSQQNLLQKKVCTDCVRDKDSYEDVVLKGLSIAQKLLTKSVDEV